MRKLVEKLFGNLSIKKQQYTLAFILTIGIVSIIALMFWRISIHPTVSKVSGSAKEKEPEVEIKNIETAVSRTDPQSMWRYQMQQDKEKIQNNIEEIKTTLAEAIEGKKNPQEQEIEALREEISNLRDVVMNQFDKQSSQAEGRDTNNSDHMRGEQNHDHNIEKITFTLDDNKSQRSKNIADTIPAGAFAKAVILGGVDASTTLNAQSDPRPMLIRLIDTGTLPRRFQSDLKDCHIISSSYADLSSERVYARLEKLTCVERQTGEIVETQVAGYVAGEDGRVGVRGIVVEKGQKYLMNSMAGGILQGVAGVMTPQQPMVYNPFSGAMGTGTEGNKDKFERGLGAGAASSMDRLSKYYIDRAEKLQPVIQVEAGRVVDVVFTEGTPIGTELVKQKLEEKRKQNAKVQNNEIEGLGEQP
jgi:conjugal transfer pilus assembly protein TraB